MRHTYKKITVICLTAFLLVGGSCKKFLELDPISNVGENQFWKTNADANLGIIAMYDAMQATYNWKQILWGDFRTDNFIKTTQTPQNQQDILANRIQTNDADALRWNEFYNIIGRANLAIEKIPQIPQYNVNLLGEAYAARAFAYFDGVRVWGSVPLMLKPVVIPENEIPQGRTDGATIISGTVIPDIEKALGLMTTDRSVNRFSRASIYCLQANVYCYLKQWDKALIAITNVEALATGNNYKLANNRTDWSYLFLNDPTLGAFERGDELIFQLKYTFAEDGKNASKVWSLLHGSTPRIYYSKILDDKWTARFPVTKAAWEAKYGVGSIPPTVTPAVPPATVPTYTYGDWRFLETREAGKANGTSQVNKYNKNGAGPVNDDTDLPIYRYSDIVLLKALVLNRISFLNKTDAIIQINKIRTARQLPPVTTTEVTALDTQDKLENYILDERQFELVGEGKRWWDLIYTDKVVQVMNPINGQTAVNLLWPVFFQHFVDNPKLLPQNPGY
jgi:hypothetical protein